MKWKEVVEDYLTFTRRDRIGITIVLVLILFIIFFPALLSKKNVRKKNTPDASWITAIKKLELKPDSAGGNITYENENNFYHYDKSEAYATKSPGEPFYFDPNTLSKNGWQKLGLRDKTIQTIQNYLIKGGHFKKAEDLQRVYGLHKNEYQRLAPFVKIQNEKQEKIAENFTGKNISNENNAFQNIYHYQVSDINMADTTALIKLPGIGSKLAVRIINFRDKLGGFYSIDQVRETFGLPDSTFQKIKQYLKSGNSSLRKININTASIDELKAHPYIRYNIANPIIAYRNEHGSFSNIEDLKKIMLITDEIYKKIAPYLSIQ